MGRPGEGRQKAGRLMENQNGLKVISEERAAEWLRVSKLDILTADEAALYCRVGLATFEKMVKELPVPFFRPRGPQGDRRFFRADLLSLMHARLENCPAKPVEGGAGR